MFADIPVTPDADEARRWVEDELARSEYGSGGEPWYAPITRWIEDLINSIDNPFGALGLGTVPALLIGIAVAAVVAAIVAFLALGPLRRARKERASAAVFDDDERSVDDLRAAVAAAEAAGDWSTAVLERFRLIVRELDARGLVSVMPGMTALEFAMSARGAAPARSADLDWAADMFDRVRYGHAAASPHDADRMAALDAALETAGSPA